MNKNYSGNAPRLGNIPLGSIGPIISEGQAIQFQVASKPSTVSLVEFSKPDYDCKPDCSEIYGDPTETKTVMTGNKIALWQRWENGNAGEQIAIYVPVDLTGVVIINTFGSNYRSETIDAKYKSHFNQILSTFKFIDQNDPSLPKISPDGSYTVREVIVGDYNTIVVKDSSGKVITNDLIKKNEKAIGYGTKFGCQCGMSFAGWIDDSHFILKIVNGNGEEYQYTINASTGIVNENSFKKFK